VARARNVKPALFKNELLGIEDPMITLLFISLWTLADRSGRLEDRPLRIKAETFPYRDGVDVNGYLTVLQRLGFIQRYKVNGEGFIQILNFEKHQSPHKTEKESSIPTPQSGSEIIAEKSDSCASTVKAPLSIGEITAALPPDSLIPDSLIPDSLIDSQEAKSPAAPKKNKSKSELDYSIWPSQPSPQVLADWQALRRDKRAKVSQTVLDSFAGELHKAATFGYSVDDCLRVAIARGWTGFKFDWLQNSLGGNHAANKQQRNQSSGGLAHDDTSWADELFGVEQSPASRRTDQQSVSVIEGNFSRVGFGDQRP
jgi:hypothetical protein